MSGTFLPLQRFEAMLRDALTEGATDVHLEPRERRLAVRLRIDGRLIHRCDIEERHCDAFIQAGKILGRMDIAERRLPQDGRAILGGSRPASLRFSSIPSLGGEGMVVRLLADQQMVRPWCERDLSAAARAGLGALLSSPNGLVVVSGPTGSGKTTLLHALLGHLPWCSLDEVKVITLEEPVEIRNAQYFLQLEVDERIGRGFGELLRHVLRHDPDIVLIGETRDRGTADIALRAALAGRLCLTTLHTNSAVGAIARLVEMGLDASLVAAALRGVVAQRLVRCPCPACARPHPQRQQWIERLGLDASANLVLPLRGESCALCHGRGYRGRVPILEVAPLRELAALVAGRAPGAEIELALRRAGQPSLFDDGIRLAAAGQTTLEEVCAVTDPPLLVSAAMNSSTSSRSSSPASSRGPRGAAAFTLIETLAVLAVIAAIIAIGVPAVAKVLQNSRVRNAEGTATVVRSALVQFLSKPGSSGSYPVTEGTSPALTSEYTGGGTPTVAAVAAAATLDNILLSEGILDRPMSLRMGAQNASASGSANGFAWSPTTQSFNGTAAPTLSYTTVSRAECSVSDGINNPGVTGQTAGSAACAFNLGGTGSLIASGSRVAYLIIKTVPDADAYQLALDTDGLAQVANTASAPAAVDQALGPVVYAKDATGTGFVDVYYYLSSI